MAKGPAAVDRRCVLLTALFREAASLRGRVCPIGSLVTPCQPGPHGLVSVTPGLTTGCQIDSARRPDHPVSSSWVRSRSIWTRRSRRTWPHAARQSSPAAPLPADEVVPPLGDRAARSTADFKKQMARIASLSNRERKRRPIGSVNAVQSSGRPFHRLLFERADRPRVLRHRAVRLLSIALLASYLPARRASRADPFVTLKTE